MSNNNSTLGKEASIIALNVNDVRIFVNVNKLNNNVILNIPLVTTARHNSFSVSLDFNLKNLQISEFGKGGRSDLIEATQREVDILMNYLPEQLSIEEVKDIISAIFDEVKPEGQRDMGKVMKEATSQLKGKADMKEVSNIIKEKLQ